MNSTFAQRRTILMVDDDGEDCSLVADALREIRVPHDLCFVRNGEELFDYLHHQGKYEHTDKAPIPDLILLDLKMPRKDGRETLRELKSDPVWRNIPVIALTTSTADNDVKYCYEAGANAYITKPATFRELVRILAAITRYWFEVAELPPRVRNGGTTN